MSVERAISFTPDMVAGVSSRDINKYDMVYLGSEFCQNLLPAKDDFRLLAEAGAKKIVLLTAPMSGEGLRRAFALITWLSRRGVAFEVVVGDLGLLRLIGKMKNVKPFVSISRVLCREFTSMPAVDMELFSKKYGISRVETDSGAAVLKLLGRSLLINFHYPFRYAVLSRYCPFLRKIGVCSGRPCAGKSVKLIHPGFSAHSLFLRNNTYFFKNRTPSDRTGIKRLVYARW
ncbi:MAG TPA: hypothetical protein DCS63_07540 [Elusimicrobia bacterium]|nr:hypothetical protein [Elusimicrobiota bacterium]